jgi:hypothetical protein
MLLERAGHLVVVRTPAGRSPQSTAALRSACLCSDVIDLSSSEKPIACAIPVMKGLARRGPMAREPLVFSLDSNENT